MDNTCTVYNFAHNKQSIYYIVCVFCATSVFYLIKSVLQDLPKLILIQDSFHKFRSFTLLDLELEHTLQKHCTGGTCYTNLHFKVTSICLINDIRSNSSHTVVFAGTFLVTFPQPIRFCPCLFLHCLYNTSLSPLTIKKILRNLVFWMTPLMLSLLFKCHYT